MNKAIQIIFFLLLSIKGASNNSPQLLQNEDTLEFYKFKKYLNPLTDEGCEISYLYFVKFTRIEKKLLSEESLFYGLWHKSLNDSVSIAAAKCIKNDSIYLIVFSLSERGVEIQHSVFLKQVKFPHKRLYCTQIYFDSKRDDLFTVYYLKTKDQNVIHPDQAKIIKTRYWKIMSNGEFCVRNSPYSR